MTRRLRRLHAFAPSPVRVPWTDPGARRLCLEEVARAVMPRAAQRPLAVVWAAGGARFGAGDDEVAAELAACSEAVDLVARVRTRAPQQRHTFHLVSSAGGLFEGQAVRSPSQPPAPRRPYGELKLAQEQHVLAALPADDVDVYRPSSVYAPPARGERPGLVTVLVRDGLARRTTTIVGALHTLRDYVLAGDVARFVAGRVLARAAGAVHMLVSGHPASILQVVAGVEAALRRRVYLRLAEAWNAEDITFSPAVRAPGFTTVPLPVGIRLVHAASLGKPAA